MQSDAIFVGEVLLISPAQHILASSTGDLKVPGFSMRFAVKEWLRGDEQREITVETGTGGGDCGTPLQPGKKFLIFAHRDQSGLLWTGMCDGNHELRGDEDQDRIVQAYRELIANRTKGFIFGHVIRMIPDWGKDYPWHESEPVKGLALNAISKRGVATAYTRSDGFFIFENLLPGKYTLSVDPSTKLEIDRRLDPSVRELKEGGCAEADIVLAPATGISGRILLGCDRDASLMEVFASSKDAKKTYGFPGKSSRVDRLGRFRLWPLPPGDYSIGVKINSAPDSPLLGHYYPADVESQSSRVHVDSGEKKQITLKVLRIPELRTIYLETTKNSHSRSGAEEDAKVMQIDVDDLTHPGGETISGYVYLDAKGRASFSLYSGAKFHLSARVFRGAKATQCYRSSIIPAGSRPVTIHLNPDRSGASCGTADPLKVTRDSKNSQPPHGFYPSLP